MRTARALSYYVLCLKLGRLLPGTKTIVELIRTDHREEHCEILQRMHEARERPRMLTDLSELSMLIDRLALQQIAAAREEAKLRAASNPSNPGSPEHP